MSGPVEETNKPSLNYNENGLVAAIAQDDDAIGELQDLIQPVRHVENRDALRAEAFKMGKQAFNFRLGQARGWFIENEKLCVPIQRPGDGDLLLLCGGEIAEDLSRGNSELATGELACGFLVQARPVHAAPRVTRPAFAEEQIFGNGEMSAIGELLVNGRDAGIHRFVW